MKLIRTNKGKVSRRYYTQIRAPFGARSWERCLDRIKAMNSTENKDPIKIVSGKISEGKSLKGLIAFQKILNAQKIFKIEEQTSDLMGVNARRWPKK